MTDERARAFAALCDDLAAEHRALGDVVGRAPDAATLDAATPADGWTVRDALTHLAGFDDAARTSIVEPDAFRDDLARRLAEGDDPIEEYRQRGWALEPTSVTEWFDRANAELLTAARSADPRARIPWYGPDMSLMSSITARVMETWAHGLDVRDALGAEPSVSGRLRHVCHIGVGARAFSYAIRGLDLPAEPVDVIVTGPEGDEWRWGDGTADDRLTGSALGFALVVTQRRHVDDTDVSATGPVAEEWLAIAQAFAGAPGAGRRPGQFIDR